MKPRALLFLVAMSLLAGCSYDSIRLHERRRCAAMPETMAKACYSRTEDSRAEYEAKRRELEESVSKDDATPVDDRYEKWIP